MESSKKSPAYAMALGGMLAALAVVAMSLGTMIPVATSICPMICMLLLQVVLRICGARTAWAWYGAVALLSVLLAPDREAAAVFLVLGYYPIVKPRLEKTKTPWLWKAVLFNVSIVTMYWLLMHLFGLDALMEEFAKLGIGVLALMLVLGNVIFFLLDKVLSKRFPKR